MGYIKRLLALVFALSWLCVNAIARETITIDKVVYELYIENNDPHVYPKKNNYAYIIESRYSNGQPTGTLTIPSEIEVDGKIYEVRVIKENAFNGAAIEKLILPGSLTYIGTGAFAGCSSLKEVILQAGDEELKLYQGAFADCPVIKLSLNRELHDFFNTYCASWDVPQLFGTNIKELEIGDGVTFIPTGCFTGCSSLGTLNIPETLKGIGANAFYGCSS